MYHDGVLAELTATTTRDAILDALDSLMERQGFRKTTVDEVAKEARVGRRTVYLHFASKEDLGLSSIDRVVAKAHAAMETEAGSGGPVSERLLRVLVARVRGRVTEVARYRQSLDELFEAVRPAYMRRRAKYFAYECGLVATLLQEGVEAGAFSVEDPAETAACMVQATNAYLPYSLSIDELGRTDAIVAGVTRMSRLLVRGVLRSTSHELTDPC